LGTTCRAEDQELSKQQAAIPQHGFKLGFGDGEPVRCQSPRSAGDWWARSSPDVVDRVVADFSLYSGGASEVRELGEETVDRCVANDGLNAGDQHTGGLGWYGQQRDSVQKPVLSAVHQKAEMRQKVHTDDGSCDVGHDKPPREIRRKPKFRLRRVHP
jgi:hypothetical protein